MNQPFLIFSLDDYLYALPVSQIHHIIRAVALTPAPKAPDPILGFINMGGRFAPVLDIRKSLNRPPKPLDVNQRMIVAAVSSYLIAFIVDTVEAVIHETPSDVSNVGGDIPAGEIFPGMERFLLGVAEYQQQTVLIYNLHALFPEPVTRLAADRAGEFETSHA